MFNTNQCVGESNMDTFFIPCIPCITLLLYMHTSYNTLRNNFIDIIIFIISCKLVNTHLGVEPKWQVWDEELEIGGHDLILPPNYHSAFRQPYPANGNTACLIIFIS